MPEAEKREKTERIDFSMFKDEYLSESLEGLQKCNDALLVMEKQGGSQGRMDEMFRVFHTLKSSSKMLGFDDIAELAHVTEDLLGRMRKGELSVKQESISLLFQAVDAAEIMVKERVHRKEVSIDSKSVAREISSFAISAADTESHKSEKTAFLPTVEKIQSVKVPVALLDSIFDQVGELMINMNRLDTLLADNLNKELKSVLGTMDRIISELQENASAARMIPVGEIFQKFPRMVRDLSREQNKEVELVIEGREVTLDKVILDAISEPLIHLLRNAVGHGIELPRERQKQNKPGAGTIRLAALRAENQVLISVEDDGRGIDIERIKEVAVSKGFRRPEEVAALQYNDVIDMLFEPGFSSLEKVSGLAGRGVGLDIVKTAAARMGGTVEMTTEIGKGSKFTLKLPQVVAVMQTLMVGVGNYTCAIPSDIVVETVNVPSQDIKMIGDKPVLVLRNEVIPFISLHEILDIPRQQSQQDVIAIILNISGGFIALGVDVMMDIAENIIKPFDPIARQFKGFAGGTILGDGTVALLLDIPSLLDKKTLERKVIR